MLGWAVLAAALSGHYHISHSTVFGVGTGALAYTLGMRHAFDIEAKWETAPADTPD